MLHRRRHALKILQSAQANIQVEHLAQGHVQRTNPTDRRRERSFDADEIFFKRLNRVIGQPVVEPLERLFTGKNFKPTHLALAAISSCTAASNTRTLAAQISGPVPSPRMNGKIGFSGTFSFPR